MHKKTAFINTGTGTFVYPLPNVRDEHYQLAQVYYMVGSGINYLLPIQL